MRSSIRIRAVRAMAALGVTAALGFGGAQAFASPGAAAEGAARCTDGTCKSRCLSLGYAGGSCSGATCVCWQTST
jgi:hypothetical protein